MDLKLSSTINITLSPKTAQMGSGDRFVIDFDCSGTDPLVTVPLKNLQLEAITECWTGLQSAPDYHHWQCFHNHEFLLAKVPTSMTTTALEELSLDQVAEEAYSAIFELMQQLGYPHLCRTWNYFSDITASSAHPHNHYQLFCTGRSRAYEKYQAPLHYPAATVVGLPEDGLHIYFLAAKHAGHAIENPQQVSAYDYPKQYSQDAPLFARALLHETPSQSLFFVSGTASIRGHSSQHIDNVMQQTHASLDNIQALIKTGQEKYALDMSDLSQFTQFKVYIKRAEDLALVKSQIQQRCGQQAQCIYLQADLCRTELLVEIEACRIHNNLS